MLHQSTFILKHRQKYLSIDEAVHLVVIEDTLELLLKKLDRNTEELKRKVK